MPGFKGVGPKSSECENSGLLRLQRLVGLWGLLKNSNWTLLSLWTIGNLMRLLRLALHQMISRVLALHFSLFFLQILFWSNLDWYNRCIEMVFIVAALFSFYSIKCTSMCYDYKWAILNSILINVYTCLLISRKIHIYIPAHFHSRAKPEI